MTIIYSEAFAKFFDRNYSSWTRCFATQAADYLDELGVPERSVLDLGCGTGQNAVAFLDRGWRVTAADVSPGMLMVARHKIGRHPAAHNCELLEADATDLALQERFGACVSLDGVFNHLESEVQLSSCFRGIARSLLPGGQLIFDLFEPVHFRHWHAISVLDQPGIMVVKRGVWDEHSRRGMLRISGAFQEDSVTIWLEQNLVSRNFTASEVEAGLKEAGLEQQSVLIEVGPCCPTAASANELPHAGRTIYRAIKN